MSTTTFVSASGRARNAIAFLYVIIAMDLVTSGLNIARHRSYVSAEPSLAELPLWILYMVAAIACVVFFLQWMHRAYSNLPALGATRLNSSPGWAVGSFFVPFANLIHPLHAMREIWHHSQASGPFKGMRADGHPVPIVGYWWATYLVSNCLSNRSFLATLEKGDAEHAATAVWVGVAGSLLSVVCGFLIISIIRKIDAFQTAAHNAQQGSAS